MAEDAGAAGFQVASAYVQVNPNTDTFAEQLEGEIGALDYVVKVPVVPDTGDFAGEVDAAVAESKAEVKVPVVPDTEGFQILVGEAGTAGDEAGTAFGEGFSATSRPLLSSAALEGLGNFPVEASSAGEEAGAAFGERFAAAADAAMPAAMGAMGAEATAGAAADGEAAGLTFGERFAAVADGWGATAGEGFMGKLKGVISGDLPVMETLMGAGFVAATAVMATKFQAAMELIHTQAGVAQSAISGLSGQVLSLAGQVGESPNSLAEALYHVESAFQSSGITGQKAMQMVQIAAEGARTGGADLVDVQNALDAAVVAGIPGVNNLSQAMGVLNAIVGSGDMKMQDLADAMGTGAIAQAKLYGQSLTEVGAALAVFGDNNIRGAKAATDLRMTWQAIESPLKSGDAALAQLGLTTTQLADTMAHHGLTAAIGEFIQHLEDSKVPVADWGQYVTDIFGKRAGTGIGVLVEQYQRLQQKLGDISGATHTFGSEWAATQQTASQHADELRAGFDALMIKIGNGLLPAVNSFMAMLDRNLPAIENFGTSIAHLVAPAVTGFFSGLQSVLSVLLGPLRNITLAIAGAGGVVWALGAVKPALAAVKAALADNPFGLLLIGIALLLPLIGKLHGTLKDVVIGVTLVTAAVWLMNAAWAANPIGAVIIALAALAAGFYTAWEKSALFRDIIKDIGVVMTNVAIVIVAENRDIVVAFLDMVSTIVQGAADAFGWVPGLGGKLKTAAKAVSEFKDSVSNDFNSMISTLQGWRGSLSGAISTAHDLIGRVTTDFQDQQKAADSAQTTLDDYTESIKKNGVESDQAKQYRQQLITDLENAGVKASTAQTDVGNYTSAVKKNGTASQEAQQAREKLVQDILAASTNAQQGKTDLNNLTFAIKDHGTTSDQYKTARQQLIKDLEKAGLNAKTASGLVDGLSKSIKDVPASKLIQIIMSGTGQYTITGKAIAASQGPGGSGNAAGGLAGGGVIPGFAPGRDSVRAWLSPGEGVLVPEAVRAIGPARIHAINDHYSRHRGGSMAFGGIIPYAGGGVVQPGHFADGGYVGGVPGLGSWLTGQYANTQNVMIQAMVEAMRAAMGAAQAQAGSKPQVVVNFNGTQWPTAEQQQAMMHQLSAAVGVS